MTSNNQIYNALGLPPISSNIEDTVNTIVAKAHDDSATNDFNMARSNIYEIIQNGSSAMDALLQVAQQSQHPRAYEVLSTLMNTMITANQKLLDLQQQVREIQAADEPHNENARSVTNNLFVGSTAELQKMIENAKNGTNAN
jgi:Terminase DNA packaging enzyme